MECLQVWAFHFPKCPAQQSFPQILYKSCLRFFQFWKTPDEKVKTGSVIFESCQSWVRTFRTACQCPYTHPLPPWFFLRKKRQLPNIGQNFWKIVRLIGLHSKTYVQQNQCMMWLHSAILSESVADVNLQLCTHWATKVGSFTMKGT